MLYGDNTCQCESIADHNNIDLPKEQLQVHKGTLEALPYSGQPPPPLALPWSPQLLLQLHTQTTTCLYVRVVCTEGACSICLQVDGDEGKLCISGDGGQGVGHCLVECVSFLLPPCVHLQRHGIIAAVGLGAAATFAHRVWQEHTALTQWWFSGHLYQLTLGTPPAVRHAQVKYRVLYECQYLM